MHGRTDSYAILDDGSATASRRTRGGMVTTRVQGEGAIEGNVTDYLVPVPTDTTFVFSRFDVNQAAHRDVSRLSGGKVPLYRAHWHQVHGFPLATRLTLCAICDSTHYCPHNWLHHFLLPTRLTLCHLHVLRTLHTCCTTAPFYTVSSPDFLRSRRRGLTAA